MKIKVKTNLGNCVIAFHRNDMRLTFIDMQNYAITINNNNVDLKNFVLTSGSDVITIFDTKEFKKMYLKNQEFVKIHLKKREVKQAEYIAKCRLEKIANEKKLKKDSEKQFRNSEYLRLQKRRLKRDKKRLNLVKAKKDTARQAIEREKYLTNAKVRNFELDKKRVLEITNAKHKANLRMKNLLAIAKKKAFWEIYNEVKNFSTKADLSKLIDTENKSFDMKKKDFINIVYDFHKMYLAKIKNRKALKDVLIIDTKDYKKIWLDTFLEKIQQVIIKNYGYPNSGLCLNYNSEFKSEVSEKISWDKYYNNSNYGYPEKFHTWCIDVPKPQSEKMLYNISYEGIINIDILNRRKIGKIEILKAVWLVKKRGYCVETQIGYIAIDGDVSYHSTDSVKKAIIGLRNKITRIQKATEKQELKISELKKGHAANMSKVITRDIFKQITGACLSGINNFLAKHDLENCQSMTVAKLLPIIPKNYSNMLLNS